MLAMAPHQLVSLALEKGQQIYGSVGEEHTILLNFEYCTIIV